MGISLSNREKSDHKRTKDEEGIGHDREMPMPPIWNSR